MFYVVPRVGSAGSSAQQAKKSTGRHNRTGNCPKGTDSPKTWAVVGEKAYRLTVGQLVQFWSGGEPVLGELQHKLTISKDNGAEAFVIGAELRVLASGGGVQMTGEMKSGRKERLAMPYTLTYKRCTVQVMEDKDIPENVSKWMKP